ncbi:MAG: SpaA isopeptide-forming pilin-related protein [Faecalicoccus sp.]|uniref:SpaA isopeptide-forming pilin-related protein n=1 Tax=Faecalicoccus sp. TaxID=1971758 RepID=UPI002A9164F4|nr:SpaA isopeptide-forming pilin-related protein [Faecalicoccus sp.]MDY5233211.1 SpaA isopeptide-forming pilin-related protein [Faecalicoccus sp.]
MRSFTKRIFALVLATCMVCGSTTFSGLQPVFAQEETPVTTESDPEPSTTDETSIPEETENSSSDKEAIPEEEMPAAPFASSDEPATVPETAAPLRVAGAPDINNTITMDMRDLLEDNTLSPYDGTILGQGTDYGVDTIIPGATTIQVSNSGGPSLMEPWLLISIPKAHLPNKPSFGGSSDAYETLDLEDEENYYELYKFHNINGGFVGTYSFSFSFDREKTFDGDTIIATSKLLDASTLENPEDVKDLETVKTLKADGEGRSVQRYYRAIKKSAYIDKQLVKTYTPVNKDGIYYQNIPVLENQNTLPNSWHSEPWFMVAPVIDGTKEGLNGRFAEKVKTMDITVHLPAGFHLSKREYADTKNWKELDPSTITRHIENRYPDQDLKEAYPNREGNYGFKFLLGIDIDNLEDEEVPLDTILPMTFDTVITYQGQEEPVHLSTTLNFRLNKITFKPGGNYAIWEDNISATRNQLFTYNLSDVGTISNRNTFDEGAYVLDQNQLVDRAGVDHGQEGMMNQFRISETNNGGSPDDITGGMVAAVKELTHQLFYGNNANGDKQQNNEPLYYNYFGLDSIILLNQSKYTKEQNEERTQKAKEALSQNTLIGVDFNGNEHVIAKDVPFGTLQAIHDTKQMYQKVIMRFDKPFKLENMHVHGWASGLPTQEEINRISHGGQSYLYYPRISSTWQLVKADQDPVEQDYQESYADARFNPYTSLSRIDPLMDMTAPLDSSLTYKEGESDSFEYNPYITFSSVAVGQWGRYGDQPLENVKVITLLPDGITYEKHVSVWPYTPYVGGKVEAPEIIDNYHGSGRTAVIYTYPKIIPNDPRINYSSLKMNLKVSPNTPMGASTIETYVVYPNNDKIRPNIYKEANPRNVQAYTDALDLDEDGDRNEAFAMVSSKFIFRPPLELIASDYVGLDEQATSFTTTADLGQDSYYRINMTNNAVVPVSSAYLLDVLPSTGDHSITTDTEGNYTDRGSQFDIRLTDSIESMAQNAEVLKRFDVFYSTVEPDTLESVRDGAWVTADKITDFGTVRSIKVQLKEGNQMQPGEQVNLLLPIRIPVEKTLIDKKAINSIALSTDGKRYNESNQTALHVTKYNVKGTFFIDKNQNGTMDEQEPKVSGANVVLMKEENGQWVAAKDLDGNVIEAKTTSDGTYEFDVYQRGNYRVDFTKKTVYTFPQKGNTNDIHADNIESANQNVGSTYAFILEPSRNSAIRNGAIYSDGRTITIEKVDAKDVNKKLAGATFTLQNTVDPDVSYTVTTGEKGTAVIDNVPFGTYTLTETKAPDNYTKAASSTIEVTDSETFNSVFTVKDSLIQGSITLKKIDASTKEALSGVAFSLYKKGEEQPIQTQTTGADGVVTFEKVEYGDYVVKETGALEDYVANNWSKEASILEENQVIDLGTVENKKIEGTVTVEKTDEKDQPLQGVEFSLLQEDRVVATAISDASGVATFKNVKYGTYTLKETKGLAAYNVVTDEQTVTIDSDGQTVEAKTMVNPIKKGSITLTKVDTDTKKPLEGVTFTLYKEDGKTEVASKSTDDKGQLTFEGVEYGRYVLKETSTLPSHNLLKDGMDIVMDEQGKEIKLGQITNTIKRGSVKLIKVDSESKKPLSNVQFGLFKDGADPIYTATSNEKGEVVFSGVKYGTYTLKEISTHDAYVLSDKTKEVTISSQDQVFDAGTWTNTMKKGTVTVKKTDEKDQPLQGVEFSLLQEEQVVATAVSDASGVATFKNIKYGTYTLKETKGLAAYNVVTDVQTVTIDTDGQTVEAKTMVNPIKKGSVTLTKVDADTRQPLEGVTFGLFTNASDEPVLQETTDEKGTLTFKDVEYGDYVLKEIATLDSHNLWTGSMEIHMDEEGKRIDLGTIQNEIKKGYATLKKVDADTHQPLSDVVFGLFLKEGETPYQTAKTDEEGVVTFDKIPYGSYTVKEMEAPEGYQFNEATWDVDIEQQDQVIDLGTIVNTKIKADVVFKKVDAKTKKGLEGVVFGLYQNDECVYTSTSDKDGQVVFKDVVYGDYTLKEMQTIAGYTKSSLTREVRIRTTSELALPDFGNEPIPSKKDKGSKTSVSMPLFGSVAALLASGTGLVAGWRRKKTKK